MKLYGLKTCDTCRKARQALEKAGESVEFIDVREVPLSRAAVAQFFAAFGEDLVNRRSTTWRGLDESARKGAAVELILAHPTLMKRPVLKSEKATTLGWSAEILARHLGTSAAAS